LTFFAVIGSGVHAPSNKQPPSFSSAQPRLPEAALKGCGCIFANSRIHKNTELSGSFAAQKTHFRGVRLGLYSDTTPFS